MSVYIYAGEWTYGRGYIYISVCVYLCVSVYTEVSGDRYRGKGLRPLW